MKMPNNITLYLLLLYVLTSLSAQAQLKQSLVFNDSTIRVTEINTNTLHSDFGPCVVGDTLYFTSYSDKIFGKTDAKLRANAFYDLYKSRIDDQGNTISKREIVKEFYTQYHDGPVAYCAKTGELFVTQSYNIDPPSFPESLRTKTIRLHIMIAVNNHGKWEKITDFPFSNPTYSVGHPAITENGDTLVFSSDMPGGYGQTDLYYSIRKEGKWQTPINLGPGINTPGKEEFSFITDKNLGGSYLLFASNGREGLGGLDLYFTKFPYKEGAHIEHFLAPINSKNDDFDLVVPTDAEFGYFTSNRPGTGADDIYKFNFKRIKKPAITELYVYSGKTRRPIPNVQVTICNNQTLQTDSLGKITKLPVPDSDCKILASSFGYRDIAKTITADKFLNRKEFRDTLWMDPIIRQKIILRNILYDFDKWDILPESAKELDLLIAYLKQNPETKVDLGSHTDSRGNDNYNLILSQKRADSAIKYIVSKGIEADRITGKGYGESQLINKCANGVNCSPEEHHQNRRTEIFIR